MLEPKKLALLRILQILEKYSDENHPLTQEKIRELLDSEYGIELERKAIGRNLSLLEEAEIDICSDRRGSYICSRDFDNSELKVLIDAVLSSRYLPQEQSAQLIEKLCNLSNKYFKSHINIRNVYSIEQMSKTENKEVFYTIELINEAIENKKQIQFTYNKYQEDGKLHSSSTQYLSPYQFFVHNQRYYIFGYNHRFKKMAFYRINHMTNVEVRNNKQAKEIYEVEGYKSGINYKEIATALPYLYIDKIEKIKLKIDKEVVDHVFDWFGRDITVTNENNEYYAYIKASSKAMEYWIMQYINHVEIIEPLSLKEKIKENLTKALEKM